MEKIIEKKKELELNQKELQGIGAELEYNERNERNPRPEFLDIISTLSSDIGQTVLRSDSLNE